MLKDVVDRILAYCDTPENKRALDERILAPLLEFLWDKYSRQYSIIRNAFFLIVVLLVCQLILTVMIFRRANFFCRGTS